MFFRVHTYTIEKAAHGIVQLFPRERVTTYFIPRKPATKDCKAVAPKGMLYDKYHNLLKFLRRTGPRDSKSKADDSEDSDEGECHSDWV